ncbi:hypothetical protein [Sporomusa ovata]|uniref:hypothetical protein n=1 Tax=Sporomusa ovata TaxID=2378 RepID=UPI00048F8AE0|nr:hypothetical protein [Sporomusa ovata]
MQSEPVSGVGADGIFPPLSGSRYRTSVPYFDEPDQSSFAVINKGGTAGYSPSFGLYYPRDGVLFILWLIL